MLPEHLREIFPNGIFLELCSLAHFSPRCSFPRTAALCLASAPARGSFMLPSDSCLMTRNRQKYRSRSLNLRCARHWGGYLAGLGVGEWPVGPSPGHMVWKASSRILPSISASSSPAPAQSILGGPAVLSGHWHSALLASGPVPVSQRDTARSLSLFSLSLSLLVSSLSLSL